MISLQHCRIGLLLLALSSTGSHAFGAEDRNCSMSRRVAPDYVNKPTQEKCRFFEDPLVRFIQLRCEQEGIVRFVIAKVNVGECTLPPEPDQPEGRKVISYVAYEAIGLPLGETPIRIGDGDVTLVTANGCLPGHTLLAMLTYPGTKRRVEITVLLAD